jgi:Tfp pilus assembly protein PilN
MIEFNLLPDVKLEYLNARRLKRVVISFSVIIGASALGLFILLLLFVDVAQKVKLNKLNNNINTTSAQLKNNNNLNSILTIQNQLKTLPTIESKTPQVSRLSGYLAEIMPANATVSNLSADFQANTMNISGSADSLATVNQLVDTLKFATYSDSSSSNNQAFSAVVLTSFGYGGGSGTAKASYAINLSFDPKLFSPDENITLTVPPEITTRSILGQPSAIFKAKGSN